MCVAGKPVCTKQAHTVDHSRTANNAAAAIEQMVNTGAVSRGQFGQINNTAVAVQPETVVAPVAANNVYLSQPAGNSAAKLMHNHSKEKKKLQASSVITKT